MWPEDEVYYKAVINEIDAATGESHIYHDEGTEERLNLKNGPWRYCNANNRSLNRSLVSDEKEVIKNIHERFGTKEFMLH